MKPLKKCIILLGIIKERNANIVISHLSNSEKEKIFNEIKKNEKFTKKEINKVLLEFLDFFKKQKKPLFSIEIISLILIILSFIMVIIFYFAVDEFDKLKLIEIISIMQNMGFVYVLLYPYLSFFVRKNYGISPLTLAFKTKNIFFDLLYGLSGGVLLFFLLDLINQHINSKPMNIRGIFYLLLLTQAFFAPICEEIFFRRFLYTKIQVNINKPIAIIIVSILFALAHLPKNLIVGLLFFLSSIILTIIFELRKTLFPSFLAHSIANLSFYLV